MTTFRVSFVLAVLCSLLAGAPDSVVGWLAYDRQAILAGQAWRAWTGHLVHFGWQHAVADVAVLLAATAILERFKGWRAAAWLFLAGAPLISLALLLGVPDLQVYEGASGIATMFGVASGCCLWRAEPGLRGALVLLAMGALLKLMVDAGGVVVPGITTLPAGIQVAWQAHVVGAILGGIPVLASGGRGGRQGRVLQSSPGSAMRVPRTKGGRVSTNSSATSLYNL